MHLYKYILLKIIVLVAIEITVFKQQLFAHCDEFSEFYQFNYDSLVCNITDVELELSGTVDSFLVDWGDMSAPEWYIADVGPHLHSYPDSGTYTFTVYRYDGGLLDSCQNTFTIAFSTILNITADYSFNILDSCITKDGSEVSFINNTSSVPPPTDSFFYTWDFGDNTTSNEKDPTHIYKYPGTYRVYLQVFASEPPGCYFTAYKFDTLVIVTDSSMLSSYNVTNGCPCNELTFSTSGSADEWVWHLGNTDSMFQNNFTYTYDNPGDYIITLSVMNSSTGCTYNKSFPITVCEEDIDTFSRSNWNWYFGDTAGFSFSTTPPSALLDGKLSTVEGAATVSDPLTGDLLFYTNGVNVWTKSHVIMPGSTSPSLLGGNSSVQAALIVPFPGNPDKYYIFTSNGSTNTKEGYYYHIVDLSIGVEGEVIVKNIPLMNSANCGNLPTKKLGNECLSGTLGKKKTCSSNEEYWIVLPRCGNEYISYLLTDQGISDSVVSLFDSIDIYSPVSAWQSAFAPNGRRFAVCEGKWIFVMDFDPETGRLYNRQKFSAGGQSTLAIPYSVCFSPNSNVLYATALNLYQYDLSSMNFEQSLFSLGSFATINIYLGPDKKMYGHKYDATSMDVIENPDSIGSAANYSTGTISLSGRKSRFGIQNIIELFPAQVDSGDTLHALFSIEISQTCYNPTVSFNNLSDTIPAATDCRFNSPDDTLRFMWYFGDGDSASTFNTVHTYNSNGTYTAMLLLFRDELCHIDTFTELITIANTSIFSFSYTDSCAQDSITLMANIQQGDTINYFINWPAFVNDTGKIVKTFFEDVGEYIIQMEILYQDSCSFVFTDTLNIINCDFFIPNAFSPDGDGLNDLFSITGTFKEATLFIYNRHGKLLYSSTQSYLWDGTYNGKKVSQGVYGYYFYGTDAKNKEIKRSGNVAVTY